MKKSQFFERTDKIALFLLVVCLGFRDIYPSIGKDVYVFLALIFAIPVMLLIRDLLCKRLTTKYFVGVLSVVLFYILIIPFNGNGAKYFLPLYVAAITFRKLDYKYITIQFFFMQLIALCIRMFLQSNGMLDERVWYTEKIEGGVSFDLGYGNPNALGMVSFFVCCYLYIIMYEKRKWFAFFVVLLISLFSFGYTASRTSFYLSLLLMFACFIPNRLLHEFVYQKIILLSLPLALLMSFFLSAYLLYNYSFVNIVLSGRLGLFSQLLSMFDTLFDFVTGIPIDVTDFDFPVDNVIAYMLICGGIVFVLLFIIQYYIIVQYRNYIPAFMLVVLMLIVLSGLSENYWAKFGYTGASFTWILLFNQSYINKNIRQ